MHVVLIIRIIKYDVLIIHAVSSCKYLHVLAEPVRFLSFLMLDGYMHASMHMCMSLNLQVYVCMHHVCEHMSAVLTRASTCACVCVHSCVHMHLPFVRSRA
jgi:hypothetical protein